MPRNRFSLVTKRLPLKETALAVANASFYLAQFDSRSRNFRKLSPGFCFLFPSQGQSKCLLLAPLTPKHFANVSTGQLPFVEPPGNFLLVTDPQVHANLYLWSLRRYLSPPILKGGRPRPWLELENPSPALRLVSRSALVA